MLGLVLLAAAAALPRTPKKPVAHVYQGVKVVDEYEWLEDENDPKVSKWSDAENAAARAFLDKIPGREALQKRIDKLIRSNSESYFRLEQRGGTLFAGNGFLFATLGIDCCVEVTAAH